MSSTTISRFIRILEASKKTGLARSTLYAMAQRGEFVRPVKLTRHASGFPLEAVEAWIAERILASARATDVK